MKKCIYVKEGTKTEKTKTSFAVEYCRLTIIDASGKITAKEADDLFKAFQESNLEEVLKKLKKKYRRLIVQKTYTGNIAIVELTKKRAW